MCGAIPLLPHTSSMPSALRGVQILSEVKWVPCHHYMVRPQVVDGGDGLQIRRVAVNVLVLIPC
jgi:hypothetical protein